jgi:hypothetical protein
MTFRYCLRAQRGNNLTDHGFAQCDECQGFPKALVQDCHPWLLTMTGDHLPPLLESTLPGSCSAHFSVPPSFAPGFDTIRAGSVKHWLSWYLSRRNNPRTADGGEG